MCNATAWRQQERAVSDLVWSQLDLLVLKLTQHSSGGLDPLQWRRRWGFSVSENSYCTLRWPSRVHRQLEPLQHRIAEVRTQTNVCYSHHMAITAAAHL